MNRPSDTARVGGLVGAGLAAGALAWYALRVEPQRVELTRPEVPVPGLPAAWDGATILFLADTHHWDWGEREDRVVACLDPLDPPDLIVWGGDYLGHDRGVETALRMAQSVADRFPGVPAVAVRGNAEHKILPDRLALLERGMADVGVSWLVNGWTTLPLRGAGLTVAGTDDPYYGFSDLDRTLAGIGPDAFTLLVAHSPQVAPRAAAAGVDLLLSGHTHGGQVRLPGYGAVKTQNPLSRRVDCGLFDRARLSAVLGRDPGGDLVAYVTRGIGLAFVPRVPWLAPRLLCRPEVALLTLRRRETDHLYR